MNEPVGPPPPPFFRAAAAFLDLLAVSHATRVAPLATLSNRIDGSAGRLLGREEQSPGFYQSWSAEGLIPTVIDQNPCAHLRMPRDMIFHGWSMRLFQAWQHSATMSS